MHSWHTKTLPQIPRPQARRPVFASAPKRAVPTTQALFGLGGAKKEAAAGSSFSICIDCECCMEILLNGLAFGPELMNRPCAASTARMGMDGIEG